LAFVVVVSSLSVSRKMTEGLSSIDFQLT
jgi:hypothetical protein